MIYVPSGDIHKHWRSIKTGLQKVLKKSPSNWIPEDVYSALRAGTSTLHLVDEGFLVLTPKQDYDGMTLFVWIAYGEGDVFEKYMPELEVMARQINARRIRFESTRDWSKRFRYVTTVYEKELL